MGEQDTSSTADLAARLEEVAGRLERLEARVERLQPRARADAPLERDDEALPLPALPQGTPALVGRTLLVLAGAYAIRALTDAGVVPVGAGVAAAMAYAVFWQLRADTEALAGRVQSAAFHDVAASLIAFPLVWESAARYGLLSPAAAAFAVACFFGLGLGIAWRRGLAANAAVTTALALAACLALLVSTHDLASAMATLFVICAGLEALAAAGRWPALRLPGALVLDGVALLLVAVASRSELPAGYPPLPAGLAAVALLGLPALHVAGVAVRALALGQAVGTYDVVQGAAAVALGFGGAVRVLAAHGAPVSGPATLAVALGLACYAAAFAHAERRPGGTGRNFYFFSSCGALLALGGTSVAGLDGTRPLVWAAAGVLAAALGRRHDRMTLRVHGACFVALAAAESGLLATCARTLGGVGEAPLTVTAWATAAAGAVAWLLLASDPAAARAGSGRLPQLLLAAVVLAVAGRLLHDGLCAALGGGLAEDVGRTAVLGTAVLAGLALALAFASRSRSLPELGWLVPPVVVLGGIKLLAQDLRHGRPSTLVLSLALYGLVLTLAPRLMRARSLRG